MRDGGFDAAWIHVAGELDIATARLLERALRWAEIQPRVVLDLRGLAFLDSAGLASKWVAVWFSYAAADRSTDFSC